MTTQGKATSNRIPSLDGIRAISIMMVLLSHLVGTKNFEVSPWISRLANMGSLGVKIFFVISGYLITTLLIAEYKKTGTISLLKFYFNRTFRIFPAFYMFVAVVSIVSLAGYISLNDGDLLHAITYTTNYHHNRAWDLGHIWSLAVEEQFYLIWPAIFLFFGLRGAFVASFAYLLIGPIVRVLTWHYLPQDRVGIGESFQTVADSIATGCVLAFIRIWLDGIASYIRLQKSKITIIIIFAIIFLLNYLKGYPSVMLPVGETVLNISIALVIDWCLRNEESLLVKLLNNRQLVFIGVLSYSLYLWQQPFLNRNGDSFVNSAPFNLACVFLCALLSYYFVEKPFLGLRSKLSNNWFNRQELAVKAVVEPVAE